MALPLESCWYKLHEEAPCWWIFVLTWFWITSDMQIIPHEQGLVFIEMKQDSNLLEVIHFDVCSPMGAEAHSGYHYVLTSLTIWVDTGVFTLWFTSLKYWKVQFCFRSEVRRNKRINCLRYDHRNEYLSYEFWYTVKTMWKLFRSSCHLEHHSVMMCLNVIAAPYLIWCILWCLLSNYHYRLWVMH